MYTINKFLPCKTVSGQRGTIGPESVYRCLLVGRSERQIRSATRKFHSQLKNAELLSPYCARSDSRKTFASDISKDHTQLWSSRRSCRSVYARNRWQHSKALGGSFFLDLRWPVGSKGLGKELEYLLRKNFVPQRGPAMPVGVMHCGCFFKGAHGGVIIRS